MKLRVTRGSFGRREQGKSVAYGPGEPAGDTFDGSERLLQAFGDRLAKAGNQDEPKGKSMPDEDVRAVLDANGDEAIDMLPSLTDGQLDQLAELETRKGVSKAIADEKASRAE